MAILGKGKKENKQEIEAVNYDLQGMTYTEFINPEFSTKISELRAKEKELNDVINEILNEINEKGPSNELSEIVTNLRKQYTNVIKEIDQTFYNQNTDLNLSYYAKAIDKADVENKGIDLLIGLLPKINEVISMLPEIEKCYGGEYYAPFAYTVIKNTMFGLVQSLNVEIPKLQKADKEALIKQFNERFAILEDKKKKEKEIKDKYASLLMNE